MPYRWPSVGGQAPHFSPAGLATFIGRGSPFFICRGEFFYRGALGVHPLAVRRTIRPRPVILSSPQAVRRAVRAPRRLPAVPRGSRRTRREDPSALPADLRPRRDRSRGLRRRRPPHGPDLRRARTARVSGRGGAAGGHPDADERAPGPVQPPLGICQRPRSRPDRLRGRCSDRSSARSCSTAPPTSCTGPGLDRFPALVLGHRGARRGGDPGRRPVRDPRRVRPARGRGRGDDRRPADAAVRGRPDRRHARPLGPAEPWGWRPPGGLPRRRPVAARGGRRWAPRVRRPGRAARRRRARPARACS